MRYKEYNANKVLEKSIELYWQKGVNGCSINDLVEATGVNRFSLYHEFESKQGILYASLKLYKERYSEKKMLILKEDGDLVQILFNFFMSFLEKKLPVSGCYIIHVGTELADSDPRVKKDLDNYLSEIRGLFLELLIRNSYSQSRALFAARHLLGLFCTAMSFCLIHSREEQEKYLFNGINLILSKDA